MYAVLSNPQYLVPALCLAEPVVQDVMKAYHEMCPPLQSRLTRSAQSTKISNVDIIKTLCQSLIHRAVTVWMAGRSTSTPLAAAVCVVVPRLSARFNEVVPIKLADRLPGLSPLAKKVVAKVVALVAIISRTKQLGGYYDGASTLLGKAVYLAMFTGLHQTSTSLYEQPISNPSAAKPPYIVNGAWALGLLTEVGLILAGVNPIVTTGLSTITRLAVQDIASYCLA